MKNLIPNAYFEAVGHMVTSRDAEKISNGYIKRVPELEKALKQERPRARSSSNPFDVEISGDEDEVQDWLYDGFLRPDEIGGIDKFPPDFNVPDLPPRSPCSGVADAYRVAFFNYLAQSSAVTNLTSIVDGLDGSAHPLIVLFAALFKAALEEAEAALARAVARLEWLREWAEENDCELPILLTFR